jgi:hypothetical protein
MDLDRNIATMRALARIHALVLSGNRVSGRSTRVGSLLSYDVPSMRDIRHRSPLENVLG